MAQNESHDDSLEAFFRKNLSKKGKDTQNELWETPSDKVWDNVHKDLQERKKRPIFWLWWLKYSGFAVAVLCVGVFGYQIFNDKQTILVLKKQVLQHEKAIEDLQEKQQKNDDALQNSNEKSLQFKDIQTGNNNSENDNYENKNKSLANKNIAQKPQVLKQENVVENEFSKTRNETFFAKKPKQNPEKKSDLNTFYSLSNDLNKVSQSIENQGFSLDKKNNSAFSKSKKSNINEHFSNRISDFSAIETHEVKEQKKTSFTDLQKNYLPPLSSISVDFIKSKTALEVMNMKEKNLLEESEKQKLQTALSANNNWHWSVFVGADRTYRRLVSENDTMVGLEDTENAQYTPQIGGRLSYQIGKSKRFSLETGLSFTQFALKNEYLLQLSYDENMTENAAKSYECDINSCLGTASAAVSLMKKASISMQDGEMMDWNLRTKQTISFVSVPLALRYSYLKTPKVDFSVAAGLINHYVISNKIKVQSLKADYENLFLADVSINNKAYLNPISLNALLHLNIAIRLKNDWQIWFEPNATYGLTAIFHNNKVKTYPYTIGFQVGIKQKF